DPGPDGGVRGAGGAVQFPDAAAEGRPDLDGVEDGVGELRRQLPGRALVGWGDVGGPDPRLPEGPLREAEGGVDGEDLPAVGPGGGPGLGEVAAGGDEDDVVVDGATDGGVGEVLGGGPDGGPTGGGLQGDQAGAEAAAAEEECAGGGQFAPHPEPPVEAGATARFAAWFGARFRAGFAAGAGVRSGDGF